jgi:hypothetical protein
MPRSLALKTGARLRRRPSNRTTARTVHFVEPFRIAFVSKIRSCSVSAVLMFQSVAAADVSRARSPSLISVRTSGPLLGGGLADLHRRHVLRELQWGPRPRLHLFLHCFLVLAQDAPALGGPTPVARSHIHEYDDLPGLEGAAMQVPTKQFLNELIELRQDFIAVWFGQTLCHSKESRHLR